MNHTDEIQHVAQLKDSREASGLFMYYVYRMRG